MDKKAKPKVEKKKPSVKTAKPKVEKKIIPREASICADKHCAIHKKISIRGRVFVGTVIKDKMNKTVVVEWPRRILIRKYERYMKKRSRVSAHNPKCMDAKVGDRVKIAECRPISKTKSFVVVEVLR